MIKYNSNTIYDWNCGDDNIIKVYRNNAIVYYKLTTSGGTPEYKVCYAVVVDISQYQDREFVDVYDKATEKWYKLNNLNQYEEYGIYGSGRTTTTYDGKLTIDTESSRLPSGYTEVEYITSEHLSINLNTGTYINTNYYPTDKTRVVIDYQATSSTAEHRRLFGAGHCCKNNIAYVLNMEQKYTASNREFTYRCGSGNTWVHTNIQFDLERHVADFNNDGAIYIDNTQIGTRQNTPFTATYPMYLLTDNNDGTVGLNQYIVGRVYSCQMYEDGTKIRDFVPAQRDSDSEYGLYDIVNDVFYPSSSNYSFSGGSAVQTVTYEYVYSGNSWVNVGEVSGSSRVPQGYTEVEYLTTENLSSTTGAGAYIETNYYPTDKTRTVMDYQAMVSNVLHRRLFGAGFCCSSSSAYIWNMEQAVAASNSEYTYRCGTGSSWIHSNVKTDFNRHTVDFNNNGIIYLDETQVGTRQSAPFTAETSMFLLANKNGSTYTQSEFFMGRVYSCQMYDDGTLIKDFIPCKRNSDDVYGLYDIENDTFYPSSTNVAFSGGSEYTPVEYPIYYDEKSDPLDNLSFSSMTEANTYAYNNCVYDGMKATIDGDLYEFDSESGWTEVQYYYKVEDVTTSSQGGSGWTVTGSSTNNPNPSYYDDYSTAPPSASNKFKVAKVTIFGYDSFTYYLRSSGYSSAYVVATNIDEIQTTPTGISYSTTSAITNTYNFNKAAGSAVNLSNYRRVTYNNLDKTVEHTFYVIWYNGATGSTSYINNTFATLLIPKDQSQEKWEQVTFSVGASVSGNSKNLYVDGNNSSSGGTSYFYNRWMIGLPSGSHSSYVNYSKYSICPGVTSSTFTSVDGGVRQVEYSYLGTTDKSLQFRLVDESGNTITTADTVYYSMYLNNGCGGSTSNINLTFPRTNNVKNGGYFYLYSSNNRHYIYGYQPNITLSQNYYSDNYNTYFDIPYTKLDTEAVTVTYTTYDPNDSETPTFNTVISWPYGNSGKTTYNTTSYDVPYTYSYTVSQTSNLFSADTQSFTASSASKSITFTLYPNNREFSTVADLEAYQYAWDGMIANVGDTKYKYEDGAWSEINYTVLEYLVRDSTHEGFISDLGYSLKENTVFKFKIKPTHGAGGGTLNQTNAPSDGNDYRIFWLGNALYYDYGGSRISKSVTIDVLYEFEIGNYYINNIATSSNVMSSTTQVGVATSMNRIIGLGGDTDDYYIVYYLKIYEGDTLVKNFIPIRNIYGVVTLLDTISGTECTVTNSFKGSDE